jgi:hypothetical protein
VGLCAEWHMPVFLHFLNTALVTQLELPAGDFGCQSPHYTLRPGSVMWLCCSLQWSSALNDAVSFRATVVENGRGISETWDFGYGDVWYFRPNEGHMIQGLAEGCTYLAGTFAPNPFPSLFSARQLPLVALCNRIEHFMTVETVKTVVPECPLWQQESASSATTCLYPSPTLLIAAEQGRTHLTQLSCTRSMSCTDLLG